MKTEDLKVIITDIIRKVADEYPETIKHFSKETDALLICDELDQWRMAELNGEQPNVKHIPDGLQDQVREMLSYAEDEADINIVFDDVIRFFKQAKERSRHEKIPYRGKKPYEYTPGKTAIDQDDIDEAIATWDKLMPGFKGLLDADTENEE